MEYDVIEFTFPSGHLGEGRKGLNPMLRIIMKEAGICFYIRRGLSVQKTLPPPPKKK